MDGEEGSPSWFRSGAFLMRIGSPEVRCEVLGVPCGAKRALFEPPWVLFEPPWVLFETFRVLFVTSRVLFVTS